MIDGTDLVTLLIALYGAGLSTYSAVADRRDKARRVRVTVSQGFVAVGPHVSADMMFVEASNPGFRPVHIVSMGLLLPDGEQVVLRGAPDGDQLPSQVEEGRLCRVWIETRRLAAELPRAGYSGKIKLRGFAKDATGVRFVSTPYPLDVDAWLKER